MKYKINYSIGGALQPIVTPIQTLPSFNRVPQDVMNITLQNLTNEEIIKKCSLNKRDCQRVSWSKLIKDRNINIESVLNLDDIIPTICNNTSDVQRPFCRTFYNYTKYYKYTKYYISTIAAGALHSMALQNDGTVVVWGNNNGGQRDVPVGLNNIVSIAAGYAHSMALKNDGNVVVWGRNTFGQRDVPDDLNNVVSIAAGGSHCMALQNDGTVVNWGNNGSGQRDNKPVDLNNVVSIAAGYHHSMALKNDGTVVVWGSDSHGQRDGKPDDLIARVP